MMAQMAAGSASGLSLIVNPVMVPSLISRSILFCTVAREMPKIAASEATGNRALSRKSETSLLSVLSICAV
jgi:hypothetical protein